MSPNSALLGLAFAAALGAAACGEGPAAEKCPEEESRAMPDHRSIRVQMTAEPTGLENVLALSLAGEAELTVESNQGDPGAGEIGLYRARPAPESAQGLVDMVFAPGFAGAADHTGQVVSGENVWLVTARDDGTEIRKIFSLERGPSPVRDELRRAVDRVTRDLRRSPVRVLKMEVVRWGESADRGKPFAFGVRLANTGSEPIAFANPLRRDESSEPHLLLSASRTDVPLLEQRQRHFSRRSLEAGDLVTAPPGIDPAAAVLRLAPGAAFDLAFKAALDWPPGPYGVRVVWSDEAGVRSGDRVAGVLFSRALEVRISGPAKPGDESDGPGGGPADEEPLDDGEP